MSATLSAPASRIAVCALRNDFAAMSAMSVRSGRRMRKTTRGLPSGVMASSSVASVAVVIFSR